jgi:hypothetical protein
MRFARVIHTHLVSVPDTSRWFAAAIVLGTSLFFGLTTANAASINYGNFGPVPPAGTSFLQVTESSGTDPVPLYGPPAPFSTGLDFDPTNFVATSSNGGADITDGQLNFTIMNGVGITDVSLFEAGDYSLVGLGTPATQVLAGAIMRATVTQLDGVNVAPINLLPVNASFGDALPPSVIVAPWSLGLSLNVSAQLAGLGFGPGVDATKVEIVINNQLAAVSEPNTAAFIAKKDFRIDVGVVPEPTALALAGLGLCLLAAGRRRLG